MPDVAVLETLGTFNLQLNEMSGPLPAAWGSPGALPSLTSLVINNNQFTGGQWGARGGGQGAASWTAVQRHAAMHCIAHQRLAAVQNYACCVLQGLCRKRGAGLAPCRASPYWPWASIA